MAAKRVRAELLRVTFADQEVDSGSQGGDQHQHGAEQVLPQLGEVDATHRQEDAGVGQQQGRGPGAFPARVACMIELISTTSAG